MLGIISDDLTGANTAASRLAEMLDLSARTLCVEVDPQLDQLVADEVVAVNTATRSKDRATAKRNVTSAAAWLQRAGATTIFKRFDSHLRGHVGTEVQAYMEACGLRTVFIIGAYPATQKSTVGGKMLARGMPVNQTEMKEDPLNAIEQSHIPSMLGQESNLKATILSLSWKNHGSEHLQSQLIKLARQYDAVVCDATSEGDVFRLAREIANISLQKDLAPWGLVCSDISVAAYLTLSMHRSSNIRKVPILAVMGSATEGARQQITWTDAHTGVRCIEFSKLDGETTRCVVDKVVSTLADNNDVVIHTGPRQHRSREFGRSLTFALAEATRIIVEKANCQKLVLIGGETAGEICRRLEVQSLRSLRPWQAGVTFGTMRTGTAKEIKVVTRSGAVGGKTQLAQHIWQLSCQ